MSRYSYLIVLAVLLACSLLVSKRLGIMDRLFKKDGLSRREELLLLCVATLFGIAAIYGSCFIGTSFFAYRDVGSDTVEQYVPYYLNMLDSIRNGTFGLWNFQYGLGTSFMAYQSWSFDLFNLVLVPLGLLMGDSALGLILVIIQALKILLSGMLFDRLLTRYCDTSLSRILGALLYSFSGYLLLWGQHYWLGTSVVLCTLMLLLLERLLEKRSPIRFLLVMLCTTMILIMSPYIGFMILLFAAAYMVLRVVSVCRCSSFGTFARNYLPLAIPVICGCLLSCIILVPYASLLLGESSRVDGSQSSLGGRIIKYLTGFVPLSWIPTILSRLLGSALICSSSDFPEQIASSSNLFPTVNVYEFIQLGFSAGALLLLSQFFAWAHKDTTRRDRILIGVAVALVAFYCVDFFLPALSNLFVAPKYRGSFVLAIPICIAMSVGWEKRVMPGKIAIMPLIVAGIATLAILLWSYACAIDGHNECLFFIAALCVIVVAVLAGTRTHRNAPLFLACLMIVSTSVVDGFFVTNDRIACTEEDFPDASSETDSATNAALSYIESVDSSFYRVEKTYSDWTRLDDSLIQGYSGISSYNSTLDSDVATFYRMLWPTALDGDSTYQVFVNDPDQPELLSLLNVKYILSRDELTQPYLTLINQIDGVYVYQNDLASSVVTIRSNVTSESDASSLSSSESRVSLLSSSVIVPDDVADSTEDALGPSDGVPTSSSSFSLSGGSILSGTIETASESVACLAVPYTAGWTVSVDGQNVDTFRADYGFIGFIVSPGHHDVCVSFSATNTGVGLGLSLCGLFIALASCLIMRKTANSARNGHPSRNTMPSRESATS